MKTPHLLQSFVVIVTFLLAIAASAQESAPRALFDGKSLAGWHSHGATGTKNWRVKGGAITCDAEKLALVSDAEFGDFELTLEWRVEPRGNGGIFYLIGPVESGDRVNAPECNVMDDSLSSSNQSGALYNHPQPVKSAAKKVGEWNTAKIVHHSGKVEHWINGERAVSADVRGKIPGLPASGKIALQSWSGTVAYRKIMIRALGPAETLTVVPAAPPEPATPAAPPPAPSGRTVTPAEWLKAQAAPTFRSGHTLPPLTLAHSADGTFEFRLDLAERWGYALTWYGGMFDPDAWGPYATELNVEKSLADPSSLNSKLIALVNSNPAKYKLAIMCSRYLPKRDAAPPETWVRTADGRFVNRNGDPVDRADTPGVGLVWSPEAPDSVWQEAGRLRADPLRRIREKCPITIILNGGEYGIGVTGYDRKFWERDPRIMKAKGNRSWFDYISEKIGREQTIIADAIRKAVPDRLLYSFYFTAAGSRNRDAQQVDWSVDYKATKTMSDLPSASPYYKHMFDQGWVWKAPFGDLLTCFLNSRGYDIECGEPLSYDWHCGGWFREGEDPLTSSNLSDIGLYMGFLKCCYVAGSLGGNAGYYGPKPGTSWGSPFDAANPPHWLRQFTALSEVHALFSHYDDYIRSGNLQPGPEMHRWSKEQPAFEFPTDGIARVLARKHKQRDEWLITAWAADGKDRDVSVSIAKLGKVKLRARATGSVYLASKGFSEGWCQS